MTKMRFLVLFIVVLFSIQANAGMEQTNACRYRIGILRAEVSRLQAEVANYQAQEGKLTARLSDLEREKENFPKLPLVPGALKKWKLEKIAKQISETQAGKTAVAAARERVEGALRTSQGELSSEENRLHPYRKITLRRIRITAFGEWDPVVYTDPEIIVEIGGRRIRGQEDTPEFDRELYEDVTWLDKILVFDADPNDDHDDMGAIPLKRNEIQGMGVAGDSLQRTLNGRVAHIKNKKPRGFSYTIEYDVEY